METLAELKTRFMLANHPQQRLINTDGIPLRSAAVLMAFQTGPRGIELILTQRPNHLKAHPGQIAFPGGKPEAEDRSIIDTALREAWEEIALPTYNVDVLGTLPAHNTLTGFRIIPVIGIVDAPFTATIDANEVSESFNVPLNFLMQTSNRHTLWFTRRQQQTPITFIPYQQRLIWGATAAIIDTFCRQLSNH